mmetsp:Transcript_66034/g.137922  ORF Transcript_66034/g.137922 Transcript_66034/m.137922 type:complete len:84 (+) Transcript_66034:588-839(+)
MASTLVGGEYHRRQSGIIWIGIGATCTCTCSSSMVGSGASCGRRGCGGGLELDLCLEVCNPLHVVQALALDPFADEAPPSTLP